MPPPMRPVMELPLPKRVAQGTGIEEPQASLEIKVDVGKIVLKQTYNWRFGKVERVEDKIVI